MTTTPGHQQTRLRWHTLTVSEQLAHVGSEVGRTLRALDAGHEARGRHALDRALELFDLTAADERWKGHRRREILRAREEFCRLVLAQERDAADVQGFLRYFLAPAVAARRTASR